MTCSMHVILDMLYAHNLRHAVCPLYAYCIPGDTLPGTE